MATIKKFRVMSVSLFLGLFGLFVGIIMSLLQVILHAAGVSFAGAAFALALQEHHNAPKKTESSPAQKDRSDICNLLMASL